MFGLQRERAAVTDDRLGELSELIQRAPEVPVAVGALRLEIGRAAIGIERAGIVAGIAERVAEVVQPLHEPRIELHRTAEARNRFPGARERRQHQPEVVVCDTRSRVERNRPAGTAQGFLELPELAERIAEIRVRLRVVRVERQYLAVAADGARAVAELLQRIVEIIQRLWQARIALQGALRERHRLARAAQAAQALGGGDLHRQVVRLNLEHALEPRERLLEPPLFLEHGAEVALRLGIVRQELGRPPQRRQSIPALTREHDAEDLPERPGVRLTLQKLTRLTLRLREAPLPEHDAERCRIRRPLSDRRRGGHIGGQRRRRRQRSAAVLELAAAAARAWIVTTRCHAVRAHDIWPRTRSPSHRAAAGGTAACSDTTGCRHARAASASRART